MAPKTFPAWLAGKVRNGVEVTLALHMSKDVDQVGAVFFMKRFLEGIGLTVTYHFGEPYPVDALSLDVGGGIFDGHESGLCATFLTAKLTGFLRKYPWVEPVVHDVGQLDAGEKYQGPYLSDLRGLSRLMGYVYRQAQCEIGKDPERETVMFGLVIFETIVFEARTRDSALDYMRRHGEDSVRVADLGSQGKLVVIQAPIWAQPAISDSTKREFNPRVTISMAVPNRASLSINSRKDELDLLLLAQALREAELAKRGLPVSDSLEGDGSVAFWFTPKDHWMVSCGTPKHPVAGDNVTRLTIEEVVQIVIENLPKCQKRVGK